MHYIGGKYRIGKEIADIIKLFTPSIYTEYIECFCGALGVLRYMTKHYKCYASDYHPDLIQLWKEIQKDTFIPPKNMDINIYNNSKKLKSPNSLKAYIGFGCSYGGKYYSGYVDKYSKDKKELESVKNTIFKIQDNIKNVSFSCKSYLEWKPIGKVIYCDPPYYREDDILLYRRGKKYDFFDNDEFWNVMREWSKYNIVYISELNAPDDFKCIWMKRMNRSIAINKNSSIVEKLFVHNNIYDIIV